LLLIVAAAGASLAAEQAPAVPAQNPPAAAKPAAEPVPRWAGSITGGFQVSRGTTDVDGFTLSGEVGKQEVVHEYKFEGLFSYNSVAVPGQRERYVADDRRILAFTYQHRIRGPISFVNRASAESDRQRSLNYRFLNISGVGFDTSPKDRIQATLIGGMGVVKEKKEFFPKVGARATPTVFHTAQFKLNKMWSLTEYVLFRTRLDNQSDSQVDAYAGLTGMVFTRRLGMQISYRWTYEGEVGPSFKNHNTQLSIGFTLKI